MLTYNCNVPFSTMLYCFRCSVWLVGVVCDVILFTFFWIISLTTSQQMKSHYATPIKLQTFFFLKIFIWNIWLDMYTLLSDLSFSPYNKFTVCSEDIAECLALPWPNRLVEDKFVEIHASFFQDCPTETLRDPPPNVIFALVMTPICLIPAMVVLVVLKTKNGDRRS